MGRRAALAHGWPPAELQLGAANEELANRALEIALNSGWRLRLAGRAAAQLYKQRHADTTN